MSKWYNWSKTAIVNFSPARMDDETVARSKGGYAISKAVSQGATIYSVWLLPSVHLGNYKNVDEAKEKVSQHLNKSKQ